VLGEIRVLLLLGRLCRSLHRVRLMKDRQLSFFHGARPTWLLLHWVGCSATSGTSFVVRAAARQKKTQSFILNESLCVERACVPN
jgi:hypothetical protein